MVQSRVLLGPDLLDPTPKPYRAVIIVAPSADSHSPKRLRLSAKWLPPENDRGAPSFVKRKNWPDFCVLPFGLRRKNCVFPTNAKLARGSSFASARGWLQYRLANKRGVAGPLDTWPGNCDTVTPAPVIVSPPGIDADGYAAGLRRD